MGANEINGARMNVVLQAHGSIRMVIELLDAGSAFDNNKDGKTCGRGQRRLQLIELLDNWELDTVELEFVNDIRGCVRPHVRLAIRLRSHRSIRYT